MVKVLVIELNWLSWQLDGPYTIDLTVILIDFPDRDVMDLLLMDLILLWPMLQEHR